MDAEGREGAERTVCLPDTPTVVSHLFIVLCFPEEMKEGFDGGNSIFRIGFGLFLPHSLEPTVERMLNSFGRDEGRQNWIDCPLWLTYFSFPRILFVRKLASPYYGELKHHFCDLGELRPRAKAGRSSSCPGRCWWRCCWRRSACRWPSQRSPRRRRGERRKEGRRRRGGKRQRTKR